MPVIPYLDHHLLWGVMFLTGLALGLLIGYGLIPAGKGTRL